MADFKNEKTWKIDEKAKLSKQKDRETVSSTQPVIHPESPVKGNFEQKSKPSSTKEKGE